MLYEFVKYVKAITVNINEMHPEILNVKKCDFQNFWFQTPKEVLHFIVKGKVDLKETPEKIGFIW